MGVLIKELPEHFLLQRHGRLGTLPIQLISDKKVLGGRARIHLKDFEKIAFGIYYERVHHKIHCHFARYLIPSAESAADRQPHYVAVYQDVLEIPHVIPRPNTKLLLQHIHHLRPFAALRLLELCFKISNGQGEGLQRVPLHP